MTKEQVMTTALDMFSQYGIKSVSMDDIARNTGISKRTIYEFFEDKETLLQEAIKYHNNTMRKILSELEKGPFTALDVFVLFYEEFMKHPRWYIKRYYVDVIRYPKAVEQAEKDIADFTTRCIKLLNRGGKEGVFQKDLNIEILALLAKEQLKMIQPSKAFVNHSVTEVFQTVLFTFLRGICTEKGMVILERYALKHSYDMLSRKE